MKTRTRTTLGLLSAAALLATSGVALLAGPAAADPPTGQPVRPIVGVGSDTTDQVMNGLADAITLNGSKPLASYDALGGPFRSREGNAACDYAGNLPSGTNGPGIRANGSTAGRTRLLETLQPGDPKAGCLDYARSSSFSNAATKPSVTFIPFAVDALPYAVRGDSTIPRDLSQATIRAIYACAPETLEAYRPLLPQSGSGTRQSWLQFVGLTEGNIPSCVKDRYTDPADGQEKIVQEHSGRGFVDKRNIGPFASAQWSAQSIGVIADRRFGVVLGGIDGIPAIATNVGAVGTRPSFNVIPTAKVGSTANAQDTLLNQIFVGSTSEICKQVGVIGKFGLAPSSECGNTSRATPAAP